jgi:hypothetical protein
VLLECENTLVGILVMIIVMVIAIVLKLVSDFQFQKRKVIFGIWNNKTEFSVKLKFSLPGSVIRIEIG